MLCCILCQGCLGEAASGQQHKRSQAKFVVADFFPLLIWFSKGSNTPWTQHKKMGTCKKQEKQIIIGSLASSNPHPGSVRLFHCLCCHGWRDAPGSRGMLVLPEVEKVYGKGPSLFSAVHRSCYTGSQEDTQAGSCAIEISRIQGILT